MGLVQRSGDPWLTHQCQNNCGIGLYQAVKALAGNGMVPRWMGFDWIMSNRLLVPSTDQLDCFAMTRRALGLQVNKDITVRIAEDPSLSFAWRIYCFLVMGCVRVEDREIVRFKAADTLV